MNIRQTPLSASLALAWHSLAACSATPPQRPPRLLQCNRHLLPQPPAPPMTLTWTCSTPWWPTTAWWPLSKELASRIGLDILKAGGNAVDASRGRFGWPWRCPTQATWAGRFHDGARRQDGQIRGAGLPRRPKSHAQHVPGRQGQCHQRQSLYTHYAGRAGTVAGWSMP